MIVVAAGVLAVVIILLPIYIMVLSSFKPLSRIFDLVLLPSPSSLTLDNYRQVLVSQNFPHYIGNSLFVAVTVTVVALFFHSTAGYALARLRFPGRQLIFVWILSTLMVPFAVIMIPLFILVRNLGITSSSGYHPAGDPPRIWHLPLPPVLPGDPPRAGGIRHDGRPVPLQHLLQDRRTPVRRDCHHACCGLLGANWNSYLWPLIVTQKRELWVIQIAIANFRGERTVAWNLVLAASCITIIPTVVIFLVFQRYLVEGIEIRGSRCSMPRVRVLSLRQEAQCM